MKTLNLIIAALFLNLFAFAQPAKKPSIMVIPSKTICKLNNCMKSTTVYGETKEYPDYRKAVEIEEIKLAIASINEAFSTYGFNLISLEQKLNILETEEAENNAIASKGGEKVTESDLDKLKAVARPDIIIDLTFSIKENDQGDYFCTFILEGLDAYTGASVAQGSGTGKPMIAKNVGVLVKEAVLKYIDNFQNLLTNHFVGMLTKGREIKVSIKRFPSGPEFDTEYTSKELAVTDELKVIIEAWVAKNAKNGAFATTSSSASKIDFDPINIPLFDETKTPPKAYDAQNWTNGLKKFLKKELQIESTLEPMGLGKAILIIGDK